MDYGLIFLTLSPEFVLAVAAMAVMGLDLTVLKGTSRIYRMTAAAGVMAIGIFTTILLLQYYVKDASFPLGMLVQNPLNLLVKKVILFVALTIGLLPSEPVLRTSAPRSTSTMIPARANTPTGAR